MVRFVLYNTSQHFVSCEGITFVCGFVLKSDWLLLNSRQKLYGSATMTPLSDFWMGPGNEANHYTLGRGKIVPRKYCTPCRGKIVPRNVM